MTSIDTLTRGIIVLLNMLSCYAWRSNPTIYNYLMQKTVFITGNSSGIGYALSAEYLSQGWHVYGLSRRGCDDLQGDIYDIQCDLGDQEKITPALEKLFENLKHLDLVILNAGVLGEIRNINTTPLPDIQNIMDINVWANKVILDWLLQRDISINQVIAVSSGAAVNGNKGWSGYSLSKATFNMMIKLYAVECPNIHFTSLAPGLVDTAMQDYLCGEETLSECDFPSLKKLRDARGTDMMPTPEQAAKTIIDVIPTLLKYDSGTFIDIRNL